MANIGNKAVNVDALKYVKDTIDLSKAGYLEIQNGILNLYTDNTKKKKLASTTIPEVGSGGASINLSDYYTKLEIDANKTSKRRIDFDGTSFKLNGLTLNYKQLYDYHITTPDFAFVVYGDRAYLLSYVQDGTGMKEMRFQSVIAVTDSAGISNVKTSGIYVTSSDGVNIASARIVDINGENKAYKATSITDANKNDVLYPTTKAVADYVAANSTTKEELSELQEDVSGVKENLTHKVDKVEGKGLSTNDYTDTAKAKVDAIPSDPRYTDTVYDDTAIRAEVATAFKQLVEHVDTGLAAGTNAIAEKANSADVYTKEQTDQKVAEAKPSDYEEVKRNLTTVAIDVADHEGRIYRIEQEIGQLDMQNLNFEQMIKNISTGNGKNFYPVGDQILMNYSYNNVDYECPYNVAEHGSDVIIGEEGDEVEVPSMTIEWEYTIPNGLAYDPQEAMYVVPEGGMAAGTYHFKVDGDSWNSENGKFFQFTLTAPLTVGMHLKPTKNHNTAFANTNMCVYADGKSTTALQTVKITEGNGGADLGIMGSGDLNHYQRIFLGYNRWSQSLYRQWLNSEGTGWWTPQNKFDRAPSNVDSLAGFLSNIPEEFRNVLKPVKLQTYRNTVTDDGGIDVTYDKVFLLTFANWNNESNSSIQSPGNGVEGDAYEYYRRLAEGVDDLNDKGNFKIWQTYPILIRYALNAKTSAQYVFSRSASRTYGSNVLLVGTSGYVGNSNANNGNRCRPACKICGNLPSHASAE